MTASGKFLCGVIEGFYGRPWSFETRLAYASFLPRLGLNTFIYAPKADPYLRKRWPQHWPKDQWRQLCDLSRHYRQREINWGVGLSPFELYRHYGTAQRRQLKDKLATLQELEAPILAVLFDDMPGDMASLAERQAEIINDVCAWLPGVRIMMCPTYYSFDPVLENYFGAMPAGYWPQLGRQLPEEVDIFWTGNKVCSESISAADIEAINAEIGRPVTLWDNYPVNDGAVRSEFVYGSKLSSRDHGLRPALGGHLCNPMNQGILSLPALVGLGQLYREGSVDESLLVEVLGVPTWEQFQHDSDMFENVGLKGMGEARCLALAARYDKLSGPAAREVAQWLRGEYTFDPSCLTD